MVALATLSNAQCRIGRRQLLRVSQLTIASGEHYCLFGPNGAGKSLLANLIAGKRRESQQYVDYAPGFDPRRDVFVVSFEEQQRLWQRDNRLDISEYSADAKDRGTAVSELVASARPASAQDESLLRELHDLLALQALWQKGIRFLSSGQLRRAMLARGLYGAMAKTACLLILDEPMESIDRHSRDRIRQCIDHYRDAGFSTLELCRRAADIPTRITQLILMQDLQLLTVGAPTDVMAAAEFAALTSPQPRLPDTLPELPGADSAAPHDPLLRLVDVTAAYGETVVLRNVNWQMRAGDQVLIDGPNGCGKSTLLSLIDGENHMAYGQDVTLFGQRKGSGETIWELKSHFGVVSNELHNKYIKGWRVLDVVVSGFFASVGLYDDSGSREQGQARQWLQALGLTPFANDYYHELSFGQQRLVLLARAMVKQPAILVLDEPCVGLDDYHRLMILTVLDQIAAQLPTQLIYVSHVPGEQPACINSRLTFVPHPDGGHSIHQEAL